MVTDPSDGLIRFARPDADVARGAGCLILVAEDQSTNRRILTEMLKRLGYASIAVENGELAWQELQRKGFGLLITDCRMPAMSGFQLAQKIRAAESTGDERMPIIALTADALPGTARECIAAGMDDCLTKPVELDRLEESIRHWLPAAGRLRRPASEATPDAVQPGGVDRAVLDTAPMIEAFGSVDDQVRELFQVFETGVDGYLTTLRAAIDGARFEEAEQAAHAAIGACRNAGAHELAAILYELEVALRDRAPTRAQHCSSEIPDAWARLRRAIARL